MLVDVISAVPNRPPLVGLTSACREFLLQHRVALEVIDALDSAACAGFVTVGHLTFSRVSEIPAENLAPENRACLDHGFLIIGSGLNGDPIAVEIATGRLAFICHDLLWEERYEAFEECVARTPCNIHEFWERAVSDPTFPVDSYAARDRPTWDCS